MPSLVPTLEDIKASEPIPAGKYRVKVVSHEEKPSKDGTSLNDIVVFQIVDGSDFNNRKLPKVYFSEKWITPALNFFRALGAKIEPGTTLQWDKTIDRELYVLVRNKTYEGRTMPEISDYLPLEG